MHCMYHTCTALLSCQHSVDGIPAIEALHVSDSLIVTSHAGSPLKKSGRGGGGGEKNAL